MKSASNMIVIVFGLPGSGKSFFASRLAKMIEAEYVNSDKLRMEMFEQRTYSAQEKKAVYDKMLEHMREAVRQNQNLVLDATFHKRETRHLFAKEAQGKTDIFFMEVRADEKTIRERLQRERPYSEADFEVYKLIRRQNEPLTEPHLILQSTNENIDDMLQQAGKYLKIKNDRRRNR